MSDQTDTKTPRTDAEELFHHDLVDSNFARTLEIELTTANAALRKAREALNHCVGMRPHSKQLRREALALIQQTLPKETR